MFWANTASTVLLISPALNSIFPDLLHLPVHIPSKKVDRCRPLKRNEGHAMCACLNICTQKYSKLEHSQDNAVSDATKMILKFTADA